MNNINASDVSVDISFLNFTLTTSGNLKFETDDSKEGIYLFYALCVRTYVGI